MHVQGDNSDQCQLLPAVADTRLICDANLEDSDDNGLTGMGGVRVLASSVIKRLDQSVTTKLDAKSRGTWMVTI